MPLKAVYLLVGMLVLALAPWPYAYYTLLRIVATVVFAWAAVETHKQNERNLPWVLGGLALLFVPLIDVHFSRLAWNVIDVAAAVFLLTIKSRITDPKTPAALTNGQ